MANLLLLRKITELKQSVASLFFLLISLFAQKASFSQTVVCTGGCTSNDIQIKRAYIKDANGNDVSCIVGQTATGYLYLELTTNTPRKGVSVQANIVNQDNTSTVYSSVGECFSATLNASTTVKFASPVTWTCGQKIALKDAFIAWGTGNTNFCSGSAAQCPATPSKCWRQPIGNVISIDITPCTAGAFTDQPDNVAICSGSSATFTVDYTPGSGTTTLKWQKKGTGDADFTDIGGATSKTLNITTPATSLNGTLYRAVITSTSPSTGVAPCSSISNEATLYVIGNPVITIQPSLSAVCAGAQASLSVTYTGGANGTSSLQWQKSTDNGTNWSNVSTDNPYAFATTSAMNGHKFKAIITTTNATANKSCPAESNVVTLNVVASPTAPTLNVTAPDFCNATGSIEVTNPAVGNIYKLYLDNVYSTSITYNQGASNPTFSPIAAGSKPSVKVTDAGSVCPAVDAAQTICVVAQTSAAPTQRQIQTMAEENKKPVNLGSAEIKLGVTLKPMPNPFSNQVRFMIEASEGGTGSLELYNMQGQKVKTIFSGYIHAGSNYFDLKMSGQNTGQYMYVLKMGSEKVSGKLLRTN